MKEPNQRLGRGLAALLGEAPEDLEQMPIRELSVARLEPNPYQPRQAIDPADLADLTASIKANGLLQPLLVRPHPAAPGCYQIIAGERRWRAARAAGLTAVPCLVRSFEDREAAAAALVENLQRRDLNALEEADGFRKLIDSFGLTQETLAASVGKSRSHIANVLRLLTLPQVVADHVRAGTLTAGHARAALACPDPVAAATRMIIEGLSVRQAEDLKNDAPRTERVRAKAVPDLDRSALEADLAERLGLRVEITGNGKGGLVKLRYLTLDQLDHIVARLSRA